MTKTFTRGAARRRAGDRLQHLPDLELATRACSPRLATGNPVLVKPHPRAVLPLAITVQVAREVLAEAGFDPNLVTLAAEAPGEGLAKTLAVRPEVRIIDFTGSTEFGDWLEANARQAQVYTEKAGVNTVVIDSTDDFAGMCRNLGVLAVPLQRPDVHHPAEPADPGRTASTTDGGHKSFDEVVADIAAAVGGLHRRPGPGGRAARRDRQRRRAGPARRGAASSARWCCASRRGGPPGLPGRGGPHAGDRQARPRTTRTPTAAECFGPVSFAVADRLHGGRLELFRRTVASKGAMTAAVYSTDEAVLDAAEAGCAGRRRAAVAAT